MAGKAASEEVRRAVLASRREVRRLTALVNRPWEHSTGPKSVRGKRKMSMNSQTHGTRSAAYLIAVGYADAVLQALTSKR